jgi:hypothetical protein
MLLEKLVKSLLQEKRKENIMTKTATKRASKKAQEQVQEAQQETLNKRPGSLVTYVYGQIYRGYLESKKAKKFKITNINVRRWNKILGWLKKNEYIVDFKLGDTIETACDLEVQGFDGDNLIYVNYLKAIERNMANEKKQA